MQEVIKRVVEAVAQGLQAYPHPYAMENIEFALRTELWIGIAPYLEVAEKARGWRIAEMAVPPTSNPALWEAEQARLTKHELEALQALRAAVDKLPK